MVKLKTPLLSFDARRKLGDDIVFARRRQVNIVETTPKPYNVRSLAQLSWRHMFQKVVFLWHALSNAEREAWESLGRRRHMTGYAWFVSQALRPNPGIYLPLQGGVMTGEIWMGANSIKGLPLPTGSGHATRKSYVDSFSKLFWKDTSEQALSLLNQVAGTAMTDLDLAPFTSPTAKFALLQIRIHLDAYTNGLVFITLRKNGTTPPYSAVCYASDDAPAGNWVMLHTIIGLDTSQVIEYRTWITGVAQVDFFIEVLGYIQ